MLTLDLRDASLTPAQFAERKQKTTRSLNQLLVAHRLPALRRLVFRVWVEDGDCILDALDWPRVEGALGRLPLLDAFVVDLAWWTSAPTVRDLSAQLPGLHQKRVANLSVNQVRLILFVEL